MKSILDYTFPEYIRKARVTDTPQGDFIKDTRLLLGTKHEGALRALSSRDQLVTFMKLRRAAPEAIAAAKRVWAGYEKYNQRVRRRSQGAIPLCCDDVSPGVKIGAYREADRLPRVLDTYRKALTLTQRAGVTSEFIDAVVSMTDHKGVLVIEWATVEARERFAEYLDHAWSDEGETEVHHGIAGDGEWERKKSRCDVFSREWASNKERVRITKEHALKADAWARWELMDNPEASGRYHAMIEEAQAGFEGMTVQDIVDELNATCPFDFKPGLEGEWTHMSATHEQKAALPPDVREQWVRFEDTIRAAGATIARIEVLGS